MPPGINGQTVSRIAGVVPDRCAVGVRGNRVDIVAQELQPQVVLTGAPRVARRAPVELRERAERADAADVRVLDNPDEVPRARGVVEERRRERVVHEVGVSPFR